VVPGTLSTGFRERHIVGDLTEAFQSGRSRTWYWKQVLAGIGFGIYDETLAHPIVVLRAVVVGWATLLLYYFVVEPRCLAPLFRRYFRASGYPFDPPMLIWFVLSLLVCAASGWIVARLHRNRQIPTVLLFAVSVFLFQLRGLPWVWRDATDSLTNPRFLPYLIYGLECQFLWPAAILCGGLYLLRPPTNKQVASSPVVPLGEDRSVGS